MGTFGLVGAVGADPCLSTKARASSSWSGVLRAKVSTPFIARLAMPVKVPAGGSSSRPVTPSSRMVSMHRSQRTGLPIWLTIRSSTSRPSATTVPSRLDSTGTTGSPVTTAEARPSRTSTAGCMWWVWKAPATDSGTRRARAGGSSARAASCSTVPAATIWPGPLSLAAVTPCLSSAARTSSRSPPRIAVMLVGVLAAASAIERPRSRTSTMACSGLIAPARAAAASSPTL